MKEPDKSDYVSLNDQTSSVVTELYAIVTAVHPELLEMRYFDATVSRFSSFYQFLDFFQQLLVLDFFRSPAKLALNSSFMPDHPGEYQESPSYRLIHLPLLP